MCANMMDERLVPVNDDGWQSEPADGSKRFEKWLEAAQCSCSCNCSCEVIVVGVVVVAQRSVV